MRAYKCDICDKLFERTVKPDITIYVYHHPYGEDRLDICDECQSKLEAWVKKETNEPSEQP